MSNTAKVCWCLSCMDENQLITDVEFFHWLRPVFRLIFFVTCNQFNCQIENFLQPDVQSPTTRHFESNSFEQALPDT